MLKRPSESATGRARRVGLRVPAEFVGWTLIDGRMGRTWRPVYRRGGMVVIGENVNNSRVDFHVEMIKEKFNEM